MKILITILTIISFMGCQNNAMITEMDVAVKYGDNEEYQKALDKIADIEEKYGESIETLTMGGKYKEKLDNYNAAIEDYKKALNLSEIEPFSSKEEIYSLLAYCYNCTDSFELAITYANKAIDIDPENFDPIYQRAHANENLHRNLDALFDYSKAIELKPELAELYSIRCIVNIDLNNFSQAVSDAKTSLRLSPGNSRALTNLSVAYNDMGNFDSSYYFINMAIDMEPSIIRYSNRSLLKIQFKDTIGAIADLNKAVALEPENPEGYSFRASGYAALGFMEKALYDINKTVQLDSTNAYYYQDRGFYYYRLNEYKMAIVDLNKAIGIDSGNFLAYNNRGNSKFQLGDTNGACEDWHIALENGYVYEAKWKEQYNIDDPAELIKKYCNKISGTPN